MTYPQVGTYPLTFETAGNYAFVRAQNSDKTGYAPDSFGDFLYPNIFGGAENTTPNFWEIISRVFCHVLSPRNLNGFEGTFSKKDKTMTTLSDVYGVCINLRQILNRIIENPEYTAADDDAEDAICTAINSLASAMAYLPLEDISDRKIKIQILKKTITEAAEDRDGNVDIDRLTPCAREQMAMVEQLLEA